jgi:ketosteroid isomerase-like protein
MASEGDRALRDREQIEALIYEYAAKMDRGDLVGVAALFADATYGATGRPALRGSEQVERVLRQSVKLYDGCPHTKHVTTNVVVEMDPGGESAQAASYFQVLQAAPGGPLATIAAGRYEDRFVRRAGGWSFAERVIHMDLVGDLSRHLMIELPRRP